MDASHFTLYLIQVMYEDAELSVKKMEETVHGSYSWCRPVSYTHLDVYKRQAKQGKKLTLNLGYSHPVEMEDPEGIETKVDGNKIIVSGISKEKVGQFAAEIRDKRRPEPYKGKGITYDTEVIRRKVGKTGKK